MKHTLSGVCSLKVGVAKVSRPPAKILYDTLEGDTKLNLYLCYTWHGMHLDLAHRQMQLNYVDLALPHSTTPDTQELVKDRLHYTLSFLQVSSSTQFLVTRGTSVDPSDAAMLYKVS